MFHTRGTRAVFSPHPSFPWKQLASIELALKAWMVEAMHSIRLLNLLKGYPFTQSVSKNETYSCAPRKNVWWNEDTNMKTARCPLWNGRRFRETPGAVKNKRDPDVCLVESGHQNQTCCLAQRFCWLEPVVPPPLSPTFLLLLQPSFLLFLPLTPPHSHSSYPHLQGVGWVGIFELKQLFQVMAVHLLSAPYPSIISFRRWFIYTLTWSYTWRTVWVASHIDSLFSPRSRIAQVNIFNYKVASFKPLQRKS